jgi:quercetin dioxygenase-like cupin family protein
MKDTPVAGWNACFWRTVLVDCRVTDKREGAKTMKTLWIGFCFCVAAMAADEARVTPLMTKDLAGIAGREGTMVTVEYAPGASSTEHRHNAHTFVYVLEGSVVMQVKGGKEMTLGPGQTFYESPDDVHTVSKNASTTKPAKFLVFFVKQKGAPATVPAR